MISVTILVKNGKERLAQVLDSVKDFDEVVVLDTGSTDGSQEIARLYTNVSLFEESFEGFGAAHNRMAELAKNPWILSIDADEVISSELKEEILRLNLDPECVYDLPFKNFFNGKHIRWCGWHPESHVRLYNKEATQFSDAKVHEGVITEEKKVIKLNGYVHHFSYDSLSDFLTKMERYSTLFAEQYCGKRKSSPFKALSHGAAAFWKSYLLKRGFLGGFEGFLISAYNGHTAFYKYLKLYQRNKQCSSP